jgi:hypothetical protein
VFTRQEGTPQVKMIFRLPINIIEDELFAAGIASLQENSELGIKLRTSLGGGIGNNFIQSQNQWFYGLAGISVNREAKTDQTEAIYNVEGLISAQYQFFKYEHPKATFLTYANIYIQASVTWADSDLLIILS